MRARAARRITGTEFALLSSPSALLPPVRLISTSTIQIAAYVAFAAHVLCANSLAQQPTGGALVPDWETTIPGRWEGDLVDVVEDIDGDSIADWLVYSWRNPVMVLSSRDGSVLWQHYDYGFGGFQVTDLEGDGVQEVLLMDQRAPDETGVVECLDARTGVLKWATRPIKALKETPVDSWIIDFDQDGLCEILVSDIDSDRGNGSALICVASDGHVNWVRGVRRSDALLVEDIDSDGVADIVIGDSTYENMGPLQGQGRVFRIDPISGQDVWQVAGGERFARLGAQVRAVDFDSDGVSEVLAIHPNGAYQGLFFGGAITCIAADGTRRWAAGGWESSHQFGRWLSVGDGNRDGWQDVYVGLPSTASEDGVVVALDGRTGLELWRAADWPNPAERYGRDIWFVEGPASGHDWLVVEAGPDAAALGRRELTGFDFRRADTGGRVSQVPVGITVGPSGTSSVADFNDTGEPQVILAHSVESHVDLLGVITPSLGFAWSIEEEGIGRSLFVDSGSAQRPTRIIVSQDPSKSGVRDAGAIRCFDLLTGRERWSTHGVLEGNRLGDELSPATNTSGERLGLLRVDPDYGDNRNGVRIYDLESGELKTTYLPRGDIRFDLIVAIAPDDDGNGLHRTLVINYDQFMQIGERHRKAEFMTASSNQVSASLGGQVLLNLDFNIEAAHYEYRVLASAHGTGESTLNGEIFVPLQRDRILARSEQGLLPGGVVPAAQGSLNAYGKKVVRVNFQPGQVPTSAIGLSLHFCAVAREPWADWTRCSIPVEVTFVP